MLGEIMQSRKPHVYEAVERLRFLAKNWRNSSNPSPESFQALHDAARQLPADTMRDVATAVSHFLALCNAADAHHRIRRNRALCVHGRDGDALAAAGTSALPDRLDSCRGTIAAILGQDGAQPGEVVAALAQQRVEIVLTAHPTQVHRRTMLRKHRRVSDLLAQQDLLEARSTATAFEASQLDQALRREVSSMWGSDKLRRTRPTPLEEAQGGMAVIEASIWDAVPNFLRRLDAVLAAHCDQGLPLEAAPLTFASWMGGDRDGNPNVTAEVTRSVVAMQRQLAAKLYLAQLDDLRFELSMLDCTDEVRALAAKSGHNCAEPYRAVIEGLRSRLHATMAWATPQLPDQLAAVFTRPPTRPAPPLFDADELLAPLLAMHTSLRACGYHELANGHLVDVIRRVKAFGLQLAPLDLRQEASRHQQAVAALCRLAGIHDYLEWSEERRLSWLSAELATGRPLLKRGMLERLAEFGVAEEVCEVIRTVGLIAQLPPGSLGAYVISQASAASDVLAVELLMSEVGALRPLRVVPLFETLADLNGCAQALDTLFSVPGYADRCGRKQEIMVGYSDSAKDAGRIAAMWAQFEAQEQAVKVAKKHGFELTFFHGKGGTVGRGGNPALYKAILSHPPGTIDGRFRVTEQGEMISYNFGDANIAERSLDIFTAAVLRDRFLKRPDPAPEWRDAMVAMSKASCDAYRTTVREEPRFVPYFRTATPEQDLGDLNIGSRPSKRDPKGGIESLRAIPWTFAWAQTRLHLPSWLGVGEAFAGALPGAAAASAPVSGEMLRAMYSQWPWFRTTVNLIEFLMAKSEVAIAAHYDAELVKDPSLAALGEDLRSRFQRAEEAVLAISGHTAPGEEEVLLMRSLRLLNPYIDMLNVLQVEALRRLRAEDMSPEELSTLKDALLVTVKGIATGMRNSG